MMTVYKSKQFEDEYFLVPQYLFVGFILTLSIVGCIETAPGLRTDRNDVYDRYNWSFLYLFLLAIGCSLSLLILSVQYYRAPKLKAGHIMLWGATASCGVSPLEGVKFTGYNDILIREAADLPMTKRTVWNIFYLSVLVYNTIHLLYGVIKHRTYLANATGVELFLGVFFSIPITVVLSNSIIWTRIMFANVRLGRPRVELL